MTYPLTIEAPAAQGNAAKTRAFSAQMLGCIAVPGIAPPPIDGYQGRDEPLRPLWATFAATSAALPPFVANLRAGRMATTPGKRARSYDSLAVEFLRSAPYEWHTHHLGRGIDAVSAFYRPAFVLDPGWVDPDRVAFVCAPSVAWVRAQPPPPVSRAVAMAVATPWLLAPGEAYPTLPVAMQARRDAEVRESHSWGWGGEDGDRRDAMRERHAVVDARVGMRKLRPRDVERIRRIAPIATAFLDRRIAAPILADPVFHVRLWCALLAACAPSDRTNDRVSHAGGYTAFLLPADDTVEPLPATQRADAQGSSAGVEGWQGAPWARSTTPPQGHLAPVLPDPLGDEIAAGGPRIVERTQRLYRPGVGSVDEAIPQGPRAVEGPWGPDDRAVEWAGGYPGTRGLDGLFGEVLAASFDPDYLRAVLAHETRGYLRGEPPTPLQWTPPRRATTPPGTAPGTPTGTPDAGTPAEE